MKINKVTAIAQRSEGWWAIEVPEIPGLFTQTRRLDQVDKMVRDAAKMLDYEIDEIDIRPKLSEEDERMLKELLDARSEANEAQEKASHLTRQTIDVFRKKGMTVRDIAGMIGVTPQRVSSLS
jgi:predicted RNase H-like HicB family nuclease